MASTLASPHPPIVQDAIESRRNVRRTVGLLFSLGSGAMLILAAWFEPSPTGLGTHEQLNLPSCGWIAAMDMPCPTCGMTTAFAHAADGQLVRSFLTQPMGAILAVSTAMTFLVGGYVAITGSRVGNAFSRLLTMRVGWMIAVFAIAAWVYKIFSHKGVFG